MLGEALPDAPTPTLRLDTWLMSCRAIGRTVEQFLLNEVVARATLLGYQMILGEYRPTAKNAQVAVFYPDHGFSVYSSDSECTLFDLQPVNFLPCTTYVEVEGPSDGRSSKT